MTGKEFKKAIEENPNGVVLEHKRTNKRYFVEHDMIVHCDNPRPYIYGTSLNRKGNRLTSVRVQWFRLENMRLSSV